MRILVIGGSGFIGPPLVRELLHGKHRVAVLHRGKHSTPQGAATIHADRNDLGGARDEIARFAPDVVIDLILSSERQAQGLLDAVRGHARRIVAASSMDVYRAASVLHGLDTGLLQEVPLTEDSELRTHVPYPPEVLKRVKQAMEWVDEGYDKVAVERTLARNTEMPATILRLPMIYGPGDPLHRLYPLIKRIDDRRPAILLPDDLAQWCGPRGYVENIAAAIALATTDERASARTYNVAMLSVSELEWALMVTGAAGWPGQVMVLPRQHTPAHLLMPANLAQHWTASSQRIRAELGYEEVVPLEESIRRTVAWERAHPPAEINAAQFDYAAEDAALAAAGKREQYDS
jgi:nucleoside-diphosphate-sugar epimerase